MFDIKLIRENPEAVKENIKKKFQTHKIPLVDKVLLLDESWRKLKAEADFLRHKKNEISEKINLAKKNEEDISALMKEAKEISIRIENIEKKTTEMQEEIKSILNQIPNMVSPYTPVGKENKEIKRWGKIRNFDFPVKTHVEILENLGLADFDASAKVSGKGFYYIKGSFALLNQALIRFAIDFMAKKGYQYIETPLMLNKKSIYASMDKEAIENSIYSIVGEDLNLIGTAEQSLLAMHSGDAIPESDLPKKYFSYSMCFRKEIGAHGINEKGLWRTHQFNKVEQFIFCKPEDSEKYYEELLRNSEEILQALKLPYRVVEICTSELGDWKYRSADLEVWRPTTNEYGEVMSLSNCTDYQARKLNIKCVDKHGNRRILHTLNDTALATSRILVAIVENYQQKDGTVLIPEVLWPYMNGIDRLEKIK